MTIPAPARKILAPVAALCIALLFIYLFQHITSGNAGAGAPLNTSVSAESADKIMQKQVRNELIGIAVGIITGLCCGIFLSPGTRAAVWLTLPLILLLIISAAAWTFYTPKELLWLVLPVWVLVAWCTHQGVHSLRAVKRSRSGAGQPR